MTRIFWDSMLFIYLLQGDPTFGKQVAYLRQRSIERGDEICTSSLVIGEILAGIHRDNTSADADRVKTDILNSGIHVLPFDLDAADEFAFIRAKYKASSADSINLACAAANQVDLFITGDRALHKLHVPKIKFIAGIDTNLI